MRTWRSQIIVKSTFTYLYTYDAVKANMAPKPSLIGSVLSRWRFKTCINFRYYICFTTSLILIKNQVERGDGKIDIVVKLHARNHRKISRLGLVNSFFESCKLVSQLHAFQISYLLDNKTHWLYPKKKPFLKNWTLIFSFII